MMSNVESDPQEVACHPVSGGDGQTQKLSARLVPLGGPRALEVRRTLPHRERAFVGAWCFVDHYGPVDLHGGPGMDVAPHPHTGLQTASWLFAGRIEHRDSLGTEAIVRPGELNLMTAGHGICHSEVSMASSGTLHGVQLWIALPSRAESSPPAFAHHVPHTVDISDALGTRVISGSGTVQTFLGEFAGTRSPVVTATRLIGAQVDLAPGTTWTVAVDAHDEHAVLVDAGAIEFCGTELGHGDLGIVDAGVQTLVFRVVGADPVRLVVLGGEPFDEEIVMWWNFVGRTHDDIVEARRAWNAREERFGTVDGYRGQIPWLPAPELPKTTLLPRSRLGRTQRRR